MNTKILQILKKSSLFAGIRHSDLKQLLDASTIMDFAGNAIILKESDDGDTFFIIVEGRVKICRFGIRNKEIILTIMKTGDFFGEVSLFDGRERTANVIALEPSKVLIIRREELIELIKKSPGLGMGLLRQMSLRLRQANAQIKSLSILKASGRVASVFLRLLSKSKVNNHEALTIQNPPSQEDMANMAGITRETCSRVINIFVKMGWIKREGSSIQIMDWESLKRMSR